MIRKLPDEPLLKSMKPPQLARILLLVAVTVGLGILVVTTLHAATGPSAFEAESGVLSSPAQTIALSGASGTGGVKFSGPTAGPTPTGTPPAQTNNCSPSPHLCGFPDATNTGPTTTPTNNVTDLTISSPGTYSGYNVSGCVHINANNVTFTNSIVRGDCGGGAMIGTSYADTSAGIIIDHVEVDALKTTPTSPGITGAGYTVRYSNIHSTGDGIDIQNNDSVHDNYIHDLFTAPGDHTDGLQSAGGDNSSVIHNTILAECAGCNSAMIIGADLGIISNFSASNNLIGGGGFTVYAGTGGYDTINMSFTGNRWVPDGGYGPCSFKPYGGRTILFTGNVWDDTGTPTDSKGALSC